MSLSLNNSTIVPLSSNGIFLGQNYDNILDFAEINISIKCDTGYALTYIYSQDKLNIDYQTTQNISVQSDTQFYRLPVNDRYFKLKIEATDGDMSVLNVQTIYKSNTTYQVAGNGPTSNVNIVSPVDGNGYVEVNVKNLAQDSDGAIWTDLQRINDDYIDANIGGLKVAVQNSSLNVGSVASNVNVNLNDNLGNAYSSSNPLYVNQVNVPSTYQIVDQNQNPVKVVPIGTIGSYSNNSLQVTETNLTYTQTQAQSQNAVNVSITDTQGGSILTDVSHNLLVYVNNPTLSVNSLIPSNQLSFRFFNASGNVGYGVIAGSFTLLNMTSTSDDNGSTSSYLKFYDKATAPDVSVDVPILVVLVGAYNNNAVANIRVTNGISYYLVGGISDTDNTGANSNCSITFNYIPN